MLFGPQEDDSKKNEVFHSSPGSRRRKKNRGRGGSSSNSMVGTSSFSSSSRLKRGTSNSVVSEVPMKHTNSKSLKIQTKEPNNGESILLQIKNSNTNRREQGTGYFSCMYDAVWTALHFKKKTPKLISNTSIKSICVTGIDGFLASWIVHELLSRGYVVRGTVQNRNDDISGLLELPNSNNLTIVETSLLTPEACDIAVQGCDFVIHTGTPSSCAVRDPLSEQQEPGVHSVGSRMHCIIPMMTNFIQACARARVKRVVLTSSLAAMADSVTPASIVNDTCWNVTSSLERNPHFLSLKLAEEAAWQLVDQLPRDCRIDLISINPGTIFGPAICKGKLGPGNQIIYDLICGQYSALVDLNWSMVDVRDCALAHVLALENIEARGRFICVNKTIWMKEVVETLSQNGYSGRDLPWKVGLPNWVTRLPSYSTQLGQVGASLYGVDQNGNRSSPYMNEKIIEVLQLKFRSVETTIIESANDLLKWGLIKPWAEDHEASECDCCKLPFTFYRRKHHCRECGVIICAECSLSRAIMDSTSEEKARLCDKCVKNSIPALLQLLDDEDFSNKRRAIIALESLMANTNNHEYVTRSNGIIRVLAALHAPDEIVSNHAAGTMYALSNNVSSSLQLVLEGAVLQMLEVDETSPTWIVCLQALRNIWKQIGRYDFRKMLHAVSRVSRDGNLKGNILLTFVHMMDSQEVPTLLEEGLMSVLFDMLQSEDVFPRCAAAHAVKHLIPSTYNPDLSIDVPPYVVDNHEELFANSSLSDLQFLVKGHIAPINAHKVVLFFRNSFFKSMFGSATSQKTMIEIDNCSYEVFSVLLRFLYTGKVSITTPTAKELLRASSYYCVYELQKRVEKFLSGEIQVDNVVELLCLAEECNAVDLKKNCVPFLMKNIHAVVRLGSYREHRVRTSVEVLKALSEMLGPQWEASFWSVKEGKVGATASQFCTHPTVQSVNTKKEQPTLSEKSSLNSVGEKSPLEVSYFKSTVNDDIVYSKARAISEDLSEGISEGIC